MSERNHAYLRTKNQQGFVLVLTLSVLVIVAIAAGYFADRVARSVELAQQSKENASAMIDIEGTRAEMLYRLCTTSMTRYGLGQGNTVIQFDDRPYHGLGNTVVRLQDNRGLLNLNATDDARLQRFLGLLSIPPEKNARLIDTLRDYMDRDDLHRLNGAEKDDYLAQKLPPPSNTPLLTPLEIRRIIGWRDEVDLWKIGRLIELTTAGVSYGVNPNTAPSEILRTLPGVTEEIARGIIDRRQKEPFSYVAQLDNLIPMTPVEIADVIVVFPSNSIRITQSSRGISWAVQYNITLTPNGEVAPWRTDYYNRVNTTFNVGTGKTIEELPPRSTAPPTDPSF